MAYHEVSLRTSNVTTSAAAVELIGSVVMRAKVLEIGITLVTAVATSLGFGHPSAVGLTPATLTTATAEDVLDLAPTTKVAASWATSPTAPALYYRRLTGSAIGQGAIWTFPKGIVLSGVAGVNNNLVLFNIVGGATLDVYAVVEE